MTNSEFLKLVDEMNAKLEEVRKLSNKMQVPQNALLGGSSIVIQQKLNELIDFNNLVQFHPGYGLKD